MRGWTVVLTVVLGMVPVSAQVTTLAGKGKRVDAFSMAYESQGNSLYFTAPSQNRVYRVDLSSKEIFVEAGNGGRCTTQKSSYFRPCAAEELLGGGGPLDPLTATLNAPVGIAIDNTATPARIFISEYLGHRVRLLQGNMMFLAAGNYGMEIGGDVAPLSPGPATSHFLRFPNGLAMRGDDVCVANQYGLGSRVLCITGTDKQNPTTIGTVESTAWGHGSVPGGQTPTPTTEFFATSGEPPQGIVFDAQGRLFITGNGVDYSQVGSSRIYRMDPVSGGPMKPWSSSGATYAGAPGYTSAWNGALSQLNARLSSPYSHGPNPQVMVGSSPNTHFLAEPGGNGAPYTPEFRGPLNPAVHAGYLYFADAANNSIRRIKISNTGTETVETAIPFGYTAATAPAAGNGTGAVTSQGLLRVPTAAVFVPNPSGNGMFDIYVADRGNRRIVYAENYVDAAGVIDGTAVLKELVFTNQSFCAYHDGPLAEAQFCNPVGVAVDESSGDVYVSDSGNHRIRKIAGGQVTTVAGTGYVGGKAGGSHADYSVDGDPLMESTLGYPTGIHFRGGKLLIGDGKSLRFRALDLTQTTPLLESIASGFTGTPTSVFLDSNDKVYVGTDTGAFDQGPYTSGVNASPGTPLTGNCAAYAAGLVFVPSTNTPYCSQLPLYGVSLDANGDLLGADSNGFLQWINGSSLTQTPLAGNGNFGYVDGPNASAEFRYPTGAAYNPLSQEVYVADFGNHVVRAVGGVYIQVTVNTTPSNSFEVDGVTYTGSNTFTWLVGTTHTVKANDPPGCAFFSKWSDNGAQSHTITAGSITTYTATYVTGFKVTAGTGVQVSPAPAANGCYMPGTPITVSGGTPPSACVDQIRISPTSGPLFRPSPYSFNINADISVTLQRTCFQPGVPPCTPPPSNLAGWYDLDEAASPARSQIATAPDMTWISGPQSTNGMVGKAMRFTGNNYLEALNTTAFDYSTQNFAVDMWVRTTQTGAAFLDKRCGGLAGGAGCGGNLQGWAIGVSNAGYLQLAVGSPSPSMYGFIDASNLKKINDGNWHFIAVSINRLTASVTFFVDPVSATDSQTVTLGPLGNIGTSKRLRIGGDQYSPAKFQGDLDEVEIFSNAVAGADFLKIFAAGPSGKCKPECVAPPSGLRLWYGFDDVNPGPAAPAANLATAYNSNLANWTASPKGTNPPVVVSGGKIGNAAQFTTSTGYLESLGSAAGNPVSSTSPHTIDMWINYSVSTSGMTTRRPIVSKLHIAGGKARGYALFLLSGTLIYGSSNASGGVDSWLIDPAAPFLEDGQWHFIAVVAQPGQAPRFFVDGKAYAPQNASILLASTAPVNSQKLRLGYFVGGPYDTKGIIDEFEFFSSALTDAQLDSIRTAGLGKCKRFVSCPAGNFSCSALVGTGGLGGTGTYTFTGNLLDTVIEVKNESPVDAFSVEIHDIGGPDGYALETALPIRVGDIPAGASRRVTFRLRRTEDATGSTPNPFELEIVGTVGAGNTGQEFGFTAPITTGGPAQLNVTIAANPANAGLQFQAGQGAALTTYSNSVTLPWNTGSQYELRTTSPQLINGREYRFTAWAPSTNPTQTQQTVTATAGQTLYTAIFQPSGYQVTLNNTGGCLLTTNPAQSNPWIIPIGQTLTINNVTAPQGSQLNSFSVTTGGATQTYSSFPVSVTVTEPVTINANCGAAQNVTLTVATNPQGLNARIGTTAAYAPAPLTQQVPAGQTQTISVTDNQVRNGSGYRFTNWSTGGSTPTTNVQPNSNFTATANFTTACHVLTFSAQPSNGGTVTASPATGVAGFPANCYAPGTQVTLTAAASTGFALQNWTGASGTANTTTVTVNAPLTVTANFSAAQPPVIEFSVSSRTNGNLSMNARNTGGSAARNLTITSISNITATGATFVYTGFPAMQVPFIVPGAATLAVGANTGFNLLFTATAGSAATAFSFTITAQADNLASFTQVVNVPGTTAPPAQATLALNAVSRTNSGNTARLIFRIDNSGSGAAGSVTATLSVNGTQPLSVVQPQVSIGTIAAGGAASFAYSAMSGPGGSIAESLFNVTLTVQYTQPGATSPSQLTRTWQSQANGTFVQLQ